MNRVFFFFFNLRKFGCANYLKTLISLACEYLSL